MDEETGIDLIIDSLVSSVHSTSNTKLPMLIDQKLLYDYKKISLNWHELDEQVSPAAGGLPSKRIERKCQQLENFLFIFKTQIYPRHTNMSPVIVDFCSGGGHLGILIAYLFPKCIVKLVENKEESLDMAIKRITELKLKNVLLYKGNLTNFVGHFNVGIAIHACGSSTDLIIEKCIESKADILISPCCYGSIKENDLIKYPRSNEYKRSLDITDTNNLKVANNYNKLIAYADRTELGIEYAKTANICMALVDSDRLLYLKSKNYGFVQLSKLLPEACTTKNNLILATF